MKKILPVVFLTTILLQTSLAQTNTYPIISYRETPEAFKYLLLSNSEISKNDTTNEKILDLVEPVLLDSVIEKRKQFHRVFLVGPLIHAFGGYNWRAVDMKKQKFVGTVKHHGRCGSFEYTEWDIKFHMQFHLQKYLFKEFKAYDLQRKYHRQDIRPSHHTNYKAYPFIHDSINIDSKDFDLGTELTPPPAFIPQLNYLFFPTMSEGGALKDHSNFGTEHPSMGFYGVTCLDCNHNCHSEMHPYEWVWWLKATDEDKSFDKTWLIGLFHEGSNRMKQWSQNPMTGTIKIPFAINIDSASISPAAIKVEHLVFNKFESEELKKLVLPPNTVSTKEEVARVEFEKERNLASNLNADSAQNMEFALQGLNNKRIPLTIQFNSILKTDGLKYWFSEVNLDERQGILSGYLHFATSVQDLYTTRITFLSNHGN